MSQTFRRTNEDFRCGNCGAEVKGNGYTNHCPRCLWSRHVDVFPGDRQELCGGMMEPVRVTKKSDDDTLTHRCTKCSAERQVKAAPGDNADALIRISEEAPTESGRA